jgi:hypothetical protein
MLEALLAATAADVQQCRSHDPNDVVVCAERKGESPYRLPRLPPKYEPRKIRAEADVIPGVHARAHVDSPTMPDGRQSNRVMVTFSIPL